MKWYICWMRSLITAILMLSVAAGAAAQETVSFPTEDGGLVYADVYGEGERGVVLAHGGRFNKESWGTQARTLESAGFHVLALDFRGYGQSRGPGDSVVLSAPLFSNVLAAVRHLRRTGAKSVSVVGGSMGAGVAGSEWLAHATVPLRNGSRRRARDPPLRTRRGTICWPGWSGVK